MSRRLGWFAACALAIGVACGGGSESPASDAAASGDSASGDESSDVSPADGSGGADGSDAATNESGSDAPSDGAGGCTSLTPDPGNVQCGGKPCTTSNNYCCIPDVDGGAQACEPKAGACSGFRRTCDEAADCVSGYVCCEGIHQAPSYIPSSDCAPDCSAPTFQLCKTSAECLGGKKCVFQVCSGWCVGTCGGLPASWCQ